MREPHLTVAIRQQAETCRAVSNRAVTVSKVAWDMTERQAGGRRRPGTDFGTGFRLPWTPRGKLTPLRAPLPPRPDLPLPRSVRS